MSAANAYLDRVTSTLTDPCAEHLSLVPEKR